jgi:hypothetical protein
MTGETMMKNKAKIGSVALAAALVSTSAFAQDKDWSVTLGIKGWLNIWDTKVQAGIPASGNFAGGSSIISQTSDWTAAAIPSLAIRYKEFFIASSYFVNRKYNFPQNAGSFFFDVGDPSGVGLGVPYTQDTVAKRKEFDINIGWYFVPQVALTLGYKQVNQHYTDTFILPPAIFPVPFTTDQTTKNKAATIGVVAGAPLGDSNFLMYFNAASSIGPTMKATYSDSSGSDKGWYATGEVGFGYRIAPGLTATLSYKYQIIDLKLKDLSPTQHARDTTNGPLLGVSYTF